MCRCIQEPPQFTPAQVLEAGRRAEAEGRLDFARQFYQHLIATLSRHPRGDAAAQAAGARLPHTANALTGIGAANPSQRATFERAASRLRGTASPGNPFEPVVAREPAFAHLAARRQQPAAAIPGRTPSAPTTEQVARSSCRARHATTGPAAHPRAPRHVARRVRGCWPVSRCCRCAAEPAHAGRPAVDRSPGRRSGRGAVADAWPASSRSCWASSCAPLLDHANAARDLAAMRARPRRGGGRAVRAGADRRSPAPLEPHRSKLKRRRSELERSVASPADCRPTCTRRSGSRGTVRSELRATRRQR